MSEVSHAHPGPSNDGPAVGVSTSPGRASALCFEALAAVTDYAAAVPVGGEQRGHAAHEAGRAVLALGAYAEELEALVTLYAQGEAVRP